MSSFFRRLFGRSRIDASKRPRDIPLPAAPNPDDLFDWSPRAKPDRAHPNSLGPAEVPRTEGRAPWSSTTVAPISEALSQFRQPGTKARSSRPRSVPNGGPAGPPSPPPRMTKPAQIRLLMADGTVVEVSGDPELERRIGYLADNLLAPLAECADPVAEPAQPFVPAEGPPGAESEPVALPNPAVAPGILDQFDDRGGELRPPSRGWPRMQLVFSDGSEAALPPDQEIVDRLAYVIANLLPARPTA